MTCRTAVRFFLIPHERAMIPEAAPQSGPGGAQPRSGRDAATPDRERPPVRDAWRGPGQTPRGTLATIARTAGAVVVFGLAAMWLLGVGLAVLLAMIVLAPLLILSALIDGPRPRNPRKGHWRQRSDSSADRRPLVIVGPGQGARTAWTPHGKRISA